MLSAGFKIYHKLHQCSFTWEHSEGLLKYPLPTAIMLAEEAASPSLPPLLVHYPTLGGPPPRRASSALYRSLA